MATNIDEVYSKALKWLKLYLAFPAKTTKLEVDFDYVSSHSAKALISLMMDLRQLIQDGSSDVTIAWKY